MQRATQGALLVSGKDGPSGSARETRENTAPILSLVRAGTQDPLFWLAASCPKGENAGSRGGAEPVQVEGKKILLTGPAGQIAFPMGRELARHNEVWGVARFGNSEDRARVEGVGIRTVVVDLARPHWDEVPDDFDYVLHLAAAISPTISDHDAIRVNAEGTGHLMRHVRNAQAFLMMSSSSVYADHPDPHHLLREGDPLGTGVRPAFGPSYRVSKISQEAVARFACQAFELPTVIGRMNAAYGANGGLPAMLLDQILADQPIGFPPNGADYFSPIHEEDIFAHLPGLLGAASVPATIANWAGDERVNLRDVCIYMAALVGKEVRCVVDEQAFPHTALDPTLRQGLAGDCRMRWQDGIRHMVASRYPDIDLRDPADG